MILLKGQSTKFKMLRLGTGVDSSAAGSAGTGCGRRGQESVVDIFGLRHRYNPPGGVNRQRQMHWAQVTICAERGQEDQ